MKCLKQKQKDELEQIIQTSKKTGEVLRAQAILMLDDGDSHMKVKQLTGFSKTHAFHLRRDFLKKGIDSLRDKREGKPKKLLTKKQRAIIIEAVSSKTPKDCGFVSEHWSTHLLGEWIKRKFKVEYKSKTSLYLVFKQAKFTYHRPGQAYDLRDEAVIEVWKIANNPVLKRFFKEKDTAILCADEMILTTATTIQKVWLPQGEFPKITCKTGGRKRRNVYGFLNLKNGDEHAFKTNFQNMHVTKDILKKIRKIYPTQKIVLYWDNAG